MATDPSPPPPPSTPQAEAQALSGPPPACFGRTFASLRHRDFRLFWAGAWLSNIGTWIQSVALGWLVLDMTDSSLQLGLVNFASSLPVSFLSFAAGIYADRLDKRRLILASQVTLMALAVVLGGMVTFGVHTIPAIMAIAFLSGVAATFSFPAWQAIISEFVPREDLLNAIALNAAQFQSARLLGPTMGGLVLALSGVAACFYLNAASYLAVVAALLLVHRRPIRPQTRRSPWEEFKEGLSYIRENTLILHLLLGVGVVSVFGLTSYAVLMPKFARDVLGGDARTLGFLMGANGGGALAGALAVASISHRFRRFTLVAWGMLAFSLSVLGFAFSDSLALSLAALVVAGFSSVTVIATLNTTIQSTVPQAVRGRVMSFFVWMFMGWMPVGSLLAGFLAERWGPPRAVALSGGVLLASSLALLVRFPRAAARGGR